MSDIVTVKQILVVRNDATTAWASSEYILEKGEIGVGWIEDTQRPIVKIGDGEHLWMQLPQSEYVFTEDLNLTHSFGKHVVENGSIAVRARGMTISEWIKDSLSARLAPIVTQPDASMRITNVFTDTETSEIGSYITGVEYAISFTPGNYEYGQEGDSEGSKNFIPTYTDIIYSAWHDDVRTEEASGLLEFSQQIDEQINKTYGSINTICCWSPAEKAPLDNLGDVVADLQIREGQKEMSQDYYVNGYREGCFFGGTSNEINEDTIRSLKSSKNNYTVGEVLLFGVRPGDDKIIVAYDARYNGPTSIYNNSVNAEMLIGDNFTVQEIEVSGANGFEPIIYKVLVYTPAQAYQNPAEISITLG